MANFVTKKELQIILELAKEEEIVCKKAKIYSKILTNTKLSDNLKKVYLSSKERLTTLSSML